MPRGRRHNKGDRPTALSGILQVRWTQKVTNVEIWKHLNAKEDLLQKVMKRKLKLFGHTARIDNSSGRLQVG